MSQLYTDYHFPVCIHRANSPEYISELLPIHDKYIEKTREKHPVSSLYPLTMTELYNHEEKISPFLDFVQQKAEQAIQTQGYDVNVFDIIVRDVFSQQHEYSSDMEQHFHSTFLSGFYFLDVPPGEIRASFYDPKDIKTFTGLKEYDYNMVTPATSVVNYKPEPGLLLLANAWLKHSFSRNPSNLPFKFVHIGVVVQYNPNKAGHNKPPIIV